VALGGVARTVDQAKRMLDLGYRVLLLRGFDWTLLQQAGRETLDDRRLSANRCRCALRSKQSSSQCASRAVLAIHGGTVSFTGTLPLCSTT
jgi:hypothetical protein